MDKIVIQLQQYWQSWIDFFADPQPTKIYFTDHVGNQHPKGAQFDVYRVNLFNEVIKQELKAGRL